MKSARRPKVAHGVKLRKTLYSNRKSTYASRKFLHGFTLVEVLLVVGVVTIIGLTAVPFYSRFFSQNAVANTYDQLMGELRKAQTYAMEGKQNGPWGVYYNTSGTKQIILYQGSSYTSRDPTFDEKFTINSNVNISFNPVLNPANDINFAQVTGTTSAITTISLSGNNTSRQIALSAQGVVNFAFVPTSAPTNTPTLTNTPTPTVTNTPTPTPTPTPAITSLTFVDAQANTDVQSVTAPTSSMTVNAATAPPLNCVNIRADTNGVPVTSIVFGLDGNASYRTENTSPYYIGGDSSGDPNCWILSSGSHTITATPYSGATAFPAYSITLSESNLLAQDTFQRADTTQFWGTASDGQTWQAAPNTNTEFSIKSNTGQEYNANNSTYSGYLLGTLTTDMEAFATAKASVFSSTNIGVIVRYTDGNNYYRGYYDGVNLRIQRKTTALGATDIFTTPFAGSANTFYNIRFKAKGTSPTTLTLHVWQNGTNEPSSGCSATGCTLTGTNSDPVPAPEYCGVRMNEQLTQTITYAYFQCTQQ